MLRVLDQDGFDAALLRPSSSSAPARLREHLESGQLAIALIRVNDLHWVVLGPLRADKVLVCDSLKDLPYEEPLEEYIRDRVYSLVLISARPP